jgi:phenylpropionate dioxygenase-like ring-hydroxylating dioxygenase large terminal subunit
MVVQESSMNKIYENFLGQSIEEAYSLPFSSYLSSDIYSLECEKIFNKDWFFACSEHEIKSPGDYKVIELMNE